MPQKTLIIVADACGKQVTLEMNGRETELDKTLIEAIQDPLTHLVRNAIDHGIERKPSIQKQGASRRSRTDSRAGTASARNDFVAAIDKRLAIIEFDINGFVVHANENFLRIMGYRLDEVRGQHHRIFVDPAFANSKDYASFWTKLNSGDYVSGEFRRLTKDGRPVWLQASYNPVAGADGRVNKFVKLARAKPEKVLQSLPTK